MHQIEWSKAMKKAFYRKWWFIVPVVLAVLLAAAGIVWSSSTVLQKTVLRIVCDDEAGVAPETREQAIAAVELLGEDVSYKSRFDNGLMDVYAKQSDDAQPLIVYAHGGYYIGGDKSSLSTYCETLASYGYVVANLNYMLAPEGQYPTQILQVNEAISYLLAHAKKYGFDPERIFIAGDSAGGHLASQMGLYYTNPAFQQEIGDEPAISAEQLRGVILHCGYYNTDTVRATGFPMIADSIWMLTGIKDYEGTAVSNEMNTVAQITADYPAVFIDSGDQDLFLSQAQEMISALEANGIDVTSYLPTSGETALQHEFQLQLDTAEGMESMELLAGFLEEKGK